MSTFRPRHASHCRSSSRSPPEPPCVVSPEAHRRPERLAVGGGAGLAAATSPARREGGRRKGERRPGGQGGREQVAAVHSGHAWLREAGACGSARRACATRLHPTMVCSREYGPIRGSRRRSASSRRNAQHVTAHRWRTLNLQKRSPGSACASAGLRGHRRTCCDAWNWLLAVPDRSSRSPAASGSKLPATRAVGIRRPRAGAHGKHRGAGLGRLRLEGKTGPDRGAVVGIPPPLCPGMFADIRVLTWEKTWAPEALSKAKILQLQSFADNDGGGEDSNPRWGSAPPQRFSRQAGDRACRPPRFHGATMVQDRAAVAARRRGPARGRQTVGEAQPASGPEGDPLVTTDCSKSQLAAVLSALDGRPRNPASRKAELEALARNARQLGLAAEAVLAAAPGPSEDRFNPEPWRAQAVCAGACPSGGPDGVAGGHRSARHRRSSGHAGAATERRGARPLPARGHDGGAAGRHPPAAPGWGHGQAD